MNKTICLKPLVFVAMLWLSASCSKREPLSDAYGNFEADEVTLSAESSGKIIWFMLKEGDKVDSGQIVARIDSTDVLLKQKQIVAQMASIKAKLPQIESQVNVQIQQRQNLSVEKDRLARLLADHAATQKQMDDISGSISLVDKQVQQTKTQFGSVNAELGVLTSQLEQVRNSLVHCTVVSPVKGTVLEKYAEQGEVAILGKPICKLAGLETLKLKVYVSGAQLPKVVLGKEVEVLVDNGAENKRKLKGKVNWISPSAEFTPKIIQTKEERVNLVYAVIVEVPNDGSLKIAMPGEVNF